MSAAYPQESASAAPAPGGRRLALYGLLALLFAVAVYSNALENGFHQDDISLITGNEYVRSLRNIPAIFSDRGSLSTVPMNAAFRPLATSIFAIDYWLGGGYNPVVFHAVQLALHLLAAALIGLLADRLLRHAGGGAESAWIALAGAMLFAVHRANTESVNYCALVSEVFATAGLMGGFLLFLCLPRARRTGLWLLPMVIAAFAKPTALVLPLLAAVWLALAQETPARGISRTGWWERGSALIGLLPAVALAAFLQLVLNRRAGAWLVYGTLSPRIYLQTQTFAWLHYFRLFLLPVGLSADYDWKPLWTASDPRVIMGVLFTLLFLGGALCYAHFRPLHGKLFLFGALWFFIALLPSSSIFPLGYMGADYRFYPAFPGLIVCAAAAAADFWRTAGRGSRITLATVMGLILLLNGWGAHQRNRDWRTEKSLWLSTIQVSPNSTRAWIGLARAYEDEGNLPAATQCLLNAKRLSPRFSTVDLNLAIVAMAEERLEDAERWLRSAREESPTDADVLIGWAVLARHRDDRSGMIISLKQALVLAPASTLAQSMLLEAYALNGDWIEYCALAHNSRFTAPDASRQQANCQNGPPVASSPGANKINPQHPTPSPASSGNSAPASR